MFATNTAAPSWLLKNVYPFILLMILLAGVSGGFTAWALGVHAARSQVVQLQGDVILPDGGLVYKTKAGKIAAKLDADEAGGFLTIYNASEKPVIVMGASEYGGGGLIGVTSGKGAGAVLQLSGRDDGGSVVLFTRGKRGVEISTDDDGGSLAVNGPTGDYAVTIETRKSGRLINGNIEVLESISGKSLWSVPKSKQ